MTRHTLTDFLTIDHYRVLDLQSKDKSKDIKTLDNQKIHSNQQHEIKQIIL